MLRNQYFHRGHRVTPAAIVTAGVFLFIPRQAAPQTQSPLQQHVQSVERTFTLQPGGLFRLSNYYGDIIVTGVAGRTVRLRAVKQIRTGDSSTAGQLLRALTFSASSSDTLVDILTRHPAAAEIARITGEGTGPASLSISYTVEVPRDIRLNVSSTSGDIRISEVNRRIDLDTMSGYLTVTGAGGPVTAGSVSGDITLADVSTRIRATCVSGDITILGGEPSEVEANNTGGNIRWEGAVMPGSLFRLSSHSGNIEFVATGRHGFEVNLSTVSGSISAPLELSLKGDITSRRSLRGEFLDPEARVELTAFSGDITLMTRQGGIGGAGY